MASSDDWYVGFIAGGLAGGILGIIFSASFNDSPKIKREAIERDYAEYIVDADGRTEWRWKDGNRGTHLSSD